MTIAIDTSAIPAVLLSPPSRAARIAVTDGCSLISVPSLPWEGGNALTAGVWKRRLAEDVVLTAWASFGMIPVPLAQPDVATALGLAVALRVCADDARHSRVW